MGERIHFDLIKSKEVAEILQCDITTVRIMTRKGMLPHCRIGNTALRYRRADIEKFVLDQIEASTKPRAEATI